MNQRLHKLLTDLHGELIAARSVSPKDRDLLQHLAEDIRAIVEAQPAALPAATDHPLRQRLAEGVKASITVGGRQSRVRPLRRVWARGASRRCRRWYRPPTVPRML